MRSFLDQNSILSDSQYGFRKGRSADLAILTLSDEMTKVHEWIKANKLLINFDKSNFMIMSSSRKAYIALKIYIFMSMAMKLSKLLNVHF